MLLPGDGIGPEIVDASVKVLEAAGSRFGLQFSFDVELIGGAAMDVHGIPLRPEVVDEARRRDAILLGAVGDPKYDDPNAKLRPEQGLLAIRKELGLFANLRPVKLYDQLVGASPVKPEVVRGTDILFVRELTGGLYFGRPSETRQTPEGLTAIDTMVYTEKEIERVVRVAFKLAQGRRKKLSSVDKANVLENSRLWRKVVERVAPEFPDVAFEHMLVDSTAMRIIKSPRDFDVVVVENTFGDILTDEASQVAGSMGMLPSASLGDGKLGMYEPAHGSAPKHAGKNTINPLATILSVAMMLRYSLERPDAADAVERAVEKTLDDGIRTRDIWEEGCVQAGTSQMGEAVAQRVLEG
ncbi:MAG TPA: 3-isopropylmalate dehydrogenase [Chloroflexota bacterium]|nr:3-isopropylmalate dehydrogenase [Chloroflexota bacterium]